MVVDIGDDDDDDDDDNNDNFYSVVQQPYCYQSTLQATSRRECLSDKVV